jgi:hypothetical protein
MAVHFAIRAITVLNGAIAVIVTLSAGAHDLFQNTPLGAFLFRWIYLSAVALPLYALTMIWRLSSQNQRGPQFRAERVALLIDAVCVVPFCICLIMVPWLGGYLW